MPCRFFPGRAAASDNDSWWRAGSVWVVVGVVFQERGVYSSYTSDNAAVVQTQIEVSEELHAAAQALLAEVQPHLNFEQGDVTMFVMDVPPDVPPEYAPVVIAQASQAQKNNVKTDRTIGVCHLIESQMASRLSAVNAISPLRAANGYFSQFEQREVGLEGKVTVLQGPEHGELRLYESTQSGRYFPADTNYVGLDRATFLVEIGGFKVKVMYFFNVKPGFPGGTEGYDPYEDKKYCPKGPAWKISLNENDPNGSLITFQHPSQLTSTLAGIVKANLTFADLATGGARTRGQTRPRVATRRAHLEANAVGRHAPGFFVAAQRGRISAPL